MTGDEIIDLWGREEIGTEKALVLLNARLLANKAYISDNDFHRLPEYLPTGPLDDPDSGWNEQVDMINNLDDAESEIRVIEGFLESLKERRGNETESNPPIKWNGTQADLARIFQDLQKNGLITGTGRAFSKHFCKKDGTPMPEDFTESRTTNQDTLSSKTGVQQVQTLIRKMKPESGE